MQFWSLWCAPASSLCAPRQCASVRVPAYLTHLSIENERACLEVSPLVLMLVVRSRNLSAHLWVPVPLHPRHCSSATLVCAWKVSVWQASKRLLGCICSSLWRRKAVYFSTSSAKVSVLWDLVLGAIIFIGFECQGTSLRSARKPPRMYLSINCALNNRSNAGRFNNFKTHTYTYTAYLQVLQSYSWAD